MTATEALKAWRKIELNSLYGLPKSPDYFYFQNVDKKKRRFESLKMTLDDITMNLRFDYQSIGKQIISENDPYGEENWEE